MVNNPNENSFCSAKEILICNKSGGLQRIDEKCSYSDPLHYVLMFFRGEQGWKYNFYPLKNIASKKQNVNICFETEPENQDEDEINSKFVTATQYYSYQLQDRLGGFISNYGRLFHQYIVEQYAKIETSRLNYILFNQKSLRADLYKNEYKPKDLSQINGIVSAELPEQVSFPQTYKTVKACMMHGHDKITLSLENPNEFNNSEEQNQIKEVIEITRFQSERYVSACESCFRIFRYNLSGQYPTTVRLSIHLENQQMCYFDQNNDISEVLSKNEETQLTAFFKLNSNNFKANDLFYYEIPKHFSWDNRSWKPRKKANTRIISRIYFVHPTDHERYALRLLLLKRKGVKSFKDIKTVDGHEYSSFRDGAHALGLIEDDREAEKSLEEACHLITDCNQLRELFVIIILNCQPANIKSLLDKFKDNLSFDILLEKKKIDSNRKYDEIIYSLCLKKINVHLYKNGKTLQSVELLDCLVDDHDFDLHSNLLIKDVLNFNITNLKKEFNDNIGKLNTDQIFAFNSIIKRLNNEQETGQIIFFIDGPGGTGKTFLYKTILAKVRSESSIALAVASSGIAALLLPGGRTAHSRFKIPISIQSTSTCHVSLQSNEAELFKKA
ncbi:unnamed protein product [Brachionus calyciflorus]|uniref:ATP-dependent DNA helicase n=1 Tax=Brachionus calyciflorus TaxID=104777 RepID=A0A814JFP2_9BILA|nr:unnamed protein product [Brachionus calyciflorus]